MDEVDPDDADVWNAEEEELAEIERKYEALRAEAVAQEYHVLKELLLKQASERSFPEPETPMPSDIETFGNLTSTSISSLRSVPKKNLFGDEVGKMLKNHDFYCSNEWNLKWANPLGNGLRHGYELSWEGGGVFDRTTGLLWQRSGSDRWLTLEGAPAYLGNLNAEKLAGRDDWRLPTLEEAMSLVEPEKRDGDLFIDPFFDNHFYTMLTADIATDSQPWIVDFKAGICLASPFYPKARVHVRAVCSLYARSQPK